MKIVLTFRFCNYVRDGGEWIFTPQVWWIGEATEYNTPSWELTDEGYNFASQYLDDASCGYDLCNGRAKGLARKYTDEQILMEIITNPKYVTHPVEDDYNLYEAII